MLGKEFSKFEHALTAVWICFAYRKACFLAHIQIFEWYFCEICVRKRKNQYLCIYENS